MGRGMGTEALDGAASRPSDGIGGGERRNGARAWPALRRWGLYLQISGAGGCSWIYRYRSGKKLRDMGLGSADTVSLKAARKAAAKWRALRTEGIDPIAKRAAGKAQEAAEGITFKEAAVKYVAVYSPSWRNEKHKAQWDSTLETFVYPIIGNTPVGKIDTDAVLSILQPQWLTKAETMGRVRGRIEAVLDFARAKGWRQGENVARWAGHLKNLLPTRSRKKRIQHHPSMPYAQAPGFLKKLREREGTTACCLEFTILTASRTSETTAAIWSEFDLDAKIWTVPANRIKGEREHKVPLSDRAVEILRKMQDKDRKWVFPGNKGRTCPIIPCWSCSIVWATATLRCTGSAAPSAIGRASRRTTRGKSASWRWRM